jgi:hypothetical protein
MQPKTGESRILTDGDYDFDYAADEQALIELWDALPDHCKTQKLWEQIKDKYPTAPFSILKPTKDKDDTTNG